MIDRIEHDDILELRFARPPVNAFTPEFLAKLRTEVQTAPANGARAIVLSGREGMFSAGLDVPALMKLDRAAMAAFWQDFLGIMRDLALSPIPVAAALTGHSPAGGAVLSLFCDTRIAAEGEFKIGLNEVQVGLPVPPIILQALQRQVGASVAEQMAVSGILLSPQQALRSGLVHQVVPVGEVIDAALEWCRTRLRLPPIAMQTTRDLARTDLHRLFANYDTSFDETFLDVWFSDETRRTMTALVESLGKK